MKTAMLLIILFGLMSPPASPPALADRCDAEMDTTQSRRAPANNPTLSTPGTANKMFWDNFYAGRYYMLPAIIEQLTASYLKNPQDKQTALLLALSHLWRIGESARLKCVPQTFLDDFIIARQYFEKALLLDPNDYRVHGFRASTLFALGRIHQTPEWIAQSIADMRTSIDLYPEFNYFTVSFVTLNLQPSDPLFQQGVEDMWLGIDACLGEPIDRHNPDYTKFMWMQTRTGVKRVCWNNDKAPHGHEGFFLGFGDMLVKNNQPEIAKIIYANAKLSPVYTAWPYKDVLEQRIATANQRAALYLGTNQTRYPRTLISEPFACMACHQK